MRLLQLLQNVYEGRLLLEWVSPPAVVHYLAIHLAACKSRHQGVSGSGEPVGFPRSSRTTTPPSTSLEKGPLH